jgi:signal transduction histidine kinase
VPVSVLVKRYLDLYGASLAVESEPGEQTRFSIVFPPRTDPVVQPEGAA